MEVITSELGHLVDLDAHATFGPVRTQEDMDGASAQRVRGRRTSSSRGLHDGNRRVQSSTGNARQPKFQQIMAFSIICPTGSSTMHASIFRLFATVLSSAAIIFACATAKAQQPNLEMHRVGVSADDGSGWHPAVSTKGAFSIRMPIPFNDFTIHDASTGEEDHAIGGKSSEGIKFMAVELPVTAKTPADLGAIPKSFSSNPANKVFDVSRQTKDGVETMSFSVTGPTSSVHIRYIKVKGMLYSLSIEFPNAYREAVAAMKDKFFGSFKLKGES
jgi:hypothetical protein